MVASLLLTGKDNLERILDKKWRGRAQAFMSVLICVSNQAQAGMNLDQLRLEGEWPFSGEANSLGKVQEGTGGHRQCFQGRALSALSNPYLAQAQKLCNVPAVGKKSCEDTSGCVWADARQGSQHFIRCCQCISSPLYLRAEHSFVSPPQGYGCWVRFQDGFTCFGADPCTFQNPLIHLGS